MNPPSFILRFRNHKIFKPMRGQGLKALALKGSLWTTAGFGLQKILQFGSNLILTRILFPEAFGIMSLISVFIVALAMFSELGIKPAIIQHKRGDDPVFLNTAWTIQVVRGFVLWIVACLIAWPLSELYDQPILFPLLCFVAVTAAIQGFQTTALATHNRKLHLGMLTIIPLISQIISVVFMVILAWIYQSVWALAAGTVAGSLINTILGHLMLPAHKHKFHVEREAFGILIKFGKWIFLTTLVGYFGGQGIRAIQGLLVTPADLGILYIAGMIAWAAGELNQKLAGVVGFPILSQIARNEPNRLHNTLERIRFRLFTLALPIFIAISFASGFLIDTLYDARYAAAGSYLAISALIGAVAVLPSGYTHSFLAVGDSRTPFIISIIAAICRVGGVYFGFQFAGILGMLVGLVIGTTIIYFFVLSLAYRQGWISPLRDCIYIGIIFMAMIFTYYLNFALVG